VPVEGGSRQPSYPRRWIHGHSAAKHLTNWRRELLTEHCWSSEMAATGSGSGEARGDPLFRELPLKLTQSCEDLQYQTSGRGCGAQDLDQAVVMLGAVLPQLFGEARPGFVPLV